MTGVATTCENYKKIDEYFNQKVLLKREDLNPNGSHKDRSIPYMIKEYQKKGISKFVISSSGNAAISAYNYSKERDIELHIFLPPNTPDYKLKKLERAKIHFTKRAVSDAFKFAKKQEYTLLRSSKDPLALEGYKKIAEELYKQTPDATDIFVPSSSGTLAVGLYYGYKEIVNDHNLSLQKTPKIHFIQTSKINTLVREHDKDFTPSDSSLAKAIVDRIGHRKKVVDSIINSGNGFGWTVDDKKIKKFFNLLKKTGINSSEEGAMGLAALEKAEESNLEINLPICIITGSKNETA